MMLWQDIRYGFRMLAASPGFATDPTATPKLKIGLLISGATKSVHLPRPSNRAYNQLA